MWQVAGKSLWIGNALEGRNLRAVLDLDIAAIVDLALEEPAAPISRELVYCRIPLLDGADNSPERLQLAVETVAALLRSETPTLVCCSAGMSRSPAVSAVSLAMVEGADPNVMLQRIVADQPHDVSPALWQEATALLSIGSAAFSPRTRLNDGVVNPG